MLREEPGVLALGKAVVEEQHHALIFLRPDDPPGGLQDLVHPGPAVGVVEARPVLGVVVAAQHLLTGTHLRQAHAHDGAADEPVAREVHALAEDAAHDPEAEKRLLRAGRKPLEERRPPGVVRLASKDFNITEEESTGVLQRLIEGKDLTLYGLSNAVTRFSQDVDNYDRATALEGIGYNILSMPRQQWNRINQMAA